MKIGILTFPKAINYGTALQAAALYKILSKRSGDVFFVDHKCDAIERSNSIFDLRSAANPKYTLAHLLNLDIALKRRKNFSDFQQKNMRFSDAPFTDYDIVVAGSDQIWNYNLTGDDYKTFFLDFTNGKTKKAAYAGSFGLSKLDDNRKESIAALLSDFDFLSVREEQAAKIIDSLISKKPPVVVDPTLLLTKNDWEQLADKKQGNGFIFVYTVFNDDALWNFAHSMSEKTGLPIKTISYSRLHRNDAQISFTAGPAQWLDCMLNASVVITNSFHGTAFSVNFHKDFYFNVPDNAKSVGSRLFDLTSRYGISDRCLSAGAPQKDIDWSAVDEKLDRDRQMSLDFIDSFITAE